MRVLAISYALPPMLYPQAIQIGRLLSHSRSSILAVSGGEVVNEAGFGGHVEHHIVPFEEPGGILHTFGVRAVPFYGAVPDSYRAWTDAAFEKIESIVAQQGKPDLIVTFGEPMSDHLLGIRLKEKFKVPWLAHFSDPWSDNPFRNLQPLSKLANRVLERRVIELADAVVFTSEETVDLVFRKYDQSLRTRTSVLPHSFDPEVYPDELDARTAGSVVLRYIGNFYGHRSPRPLIAALAHLQRADPGALAEVRVELVGGIPSRMLRSNEWKALPEGLLVARGSVSYIESLRLMKASDILLTIDAPAQESVFFPSKLADYIGAGRRLIGIVPPGAAARIIAQCGGRSISPTSPVPDIAGLLRDEIASARVQRNSGSTKSFGRSADQYNIANVALTFDALCHSVVEIAHQRPGALS